jgi:hypothetical protein
VTRVRLVLLGFALVLAAVSCIGCGAAYVPGTGQPFPSIFSATTAPGAMSMNEEFLAYPERFEIIGETQGIASSVSILGLITYGDAGYASAREDAMRRVRADGLINCTADVSSSSCLFLFAGSKTIVRGIAIKRK